MSMPQAEFLPPQIWACIAQDFVHLQFFNICIILYTVSSYSANTKFCLFFYHHSTQNVMSNLLSFYEMNYV